MDINQRSKSVFFSFIFLIILSCENLLFLPFGFCHRTLSSLAHWSAIFGELDYLPMLAFPFVKLFQNNQLVCFEVIATILGNELTLLGHLQRIVKIKMCFD